MIRLRQLLGRTWYRVYHAPTGHLRRLFQAGGPFVQHRTESGRKDMEFAAYLFDPPEIPEPYAAPPLRVHLLTGYKFWAQTAFCLHTFSKQAKRLLAPVIYDDGSLANIQRDALNRLFPDARFVSKADATAKLDRLLPRERYPYLRERWDNYPNIRKLIDPHLGSHGWKLVIDSDLLFFRAPDFLTSWLDAPALPLHAIDTETSYGYSPELLESLAGRPLAELVNVGLCGLRSEDLNWDRIEYLCRTLIEAEKTHYYLEQALVAILLAGQSCTIAPAMDYVTMPIPPEVTACRAVMHHYVADSKRWYFQRNWRRFATRH